MIPSSGQNGLSRLERRSTRPPLRISIPRRPSRRPTSSARLVLAQPLVGRRAQVPVVRPLDELDLADEPARPRRRRPCGRAASSASRRTVAHARAAAAAEQAVDLRSPKPVPTLPTQRSSPVSRRARRARATQGRPTGGPGRACQPAITNSCRSCVLIFSHSRVRRPSRRASRPLGHDALEAASQPRTARRRPRRPRRAARRRAAGRSSRSSRSALAERQRDERLAVELEQVEGDVDDDVVPASPAAWRRRWPGRPRRARRPRRPARSPEFAAGALERAGDRSGSGR